MGSTDDEVRIRDAIRDLVARYNAYGDRGRFDELLGLFASEATMELRSARREDAGRRYAGVDEIRTIFTGVRTDMRRRQSPDGPRFLQHHTSTHVISESRIRQARMPSAFIVMPSRWARLRRRSIRCRPESRKYSTASSR